SDLWAWIARSARRAGGRRGREVGRSSTRGILPVELLELPVQLGMLPLELHRPFEERFRRDGEELGFVGRAVGVEHRRSPRGGVLAESLVLRVEDTAQRTKRGGREQRCAVERGILLIQLMREFVQPDVAPVRRV